MIYSVRIKKRVRNIKVYTVLKKTEEHVNFATRLFMRLFGPQKPKVE